MLLRPLEKITQQASLAQSARVWDFYDKRNIPGLRVRVPRVAIIFVFFDCLINIYIYIGLKLTF